MVVEDELAVRDLIVELLHDEGHEVVEVADGRAALQVLERYATPQHEICLILLDLMLPRMDGITVLRHLAEQCIYIPVVAMSASRAHLATAQEVGAEAVMPKPFDLDALLGIVERTCAGRED
jgi:two-component system, OmpR family, phosphate regulon response regulator PhoB